MDQERQSESIYFNPGPIKENYNGGGFSATTEQQKITENKTENIIGLVRGSLVVSGTILTQTYPNILKYIGAAMAGTGIVYDAAEPIVNLVSEKIKAIKLLPSKDKFKN
jgi:hypothetical protein